MSNAWLVSFSGPTSDRLRGAIAAAGFVLTRNQRGAPVAPGGHLSEITRQTVLVHASSERQALARVRRALEAHPTVGDLEVRPFRR